MDFSTAVLSSCQQEVVDVHRELNQDYENHLYDSKQSNGETEFKGNNNIRSSLKTETSGNHSHNLSSYEDEILGGIKELPKNPLTSGFSPNKKAIDLSIHCRTVDGGERTIFDDAEYFSKNYSYKLLPINFEHVDETIIHTEHNYCNLSFTSGSEADEDCSRTMDYDQVKEKNYKKKKAKFKKDETDGKSEDCRNEQQLSATNSSTDALQNSNVNVPELEYSSSVQPLDLSAPLVQEEKTDHYVMEYSTPEIHNRNDNVQEEKDSILCDSDKENQKSNLKLVEVTITRDDGKCNYQPCDVFLSDVARLVPKLIEKDCKEIDILDHTCENLVDLEKHRLYYIISESTWRFFQSAKERVILTNDRSVGQPIIQNDKPERPTFLIFDQFSLAKCLADHCREIGGCFEYLCVEEYKKDKSESPEIKAENKEVEQSKNCETVEEECTTKELKLEILEDENKNFNGDATIDNTTYQNSLNKTIEEIKDVKVEPQSTTEDLPEVSEEIPEERKCEAENTSGDICLKIVPELENCEIESLDKNKVNEFEIKSKEENMQEVPKTNEGCESTINSNPTMEMDEESARTNELQTTKSDEETLPKTAHSSNSSKAKSDKTNCSNISNRSTKRQLRKPVEKPADNADQINCKVSHVRDAKPLFQEPDKTSGEKKNSASKVENKTKKLVVHLDDVGDTAQSKGSGKPNKKSKSVQSSIAKPEKPSESTTKNVRASVTGGKRSKTRKRTSSRSSESKTLKRENENENNSIRTRSKSSCESNTQDTKRPKLVPSHQVNSANPKDKSTTGCKRKMSFSESGKQNEGKANHPVSEVKKPRKTRSTVARDEAKSCRSRKSSESRNAQGEKVTRKRSADESERTNVKVNSSASGKKADKSKGKQQMEARSGRKPAKEVKKPKKTKKDEIVKKEGKRQTSKKVFQKTKKR